MAIPTLLSSLSLWLLGSLGGGLAQELPALLPPQPEESSTREAIPITPPLMAPVPRPVDGPRTSPSAGAPARGSAVSPPSAVLAVPGLAPAQPGSAPRIRSDLGELPLFEPPAPPLGRDSLPPGGQIDEGGLARPGASVLPEPRGLPRDFETDGVYRPSPVPTSNPRSAQPAERTALPAPGQPRESPGRPLTSAPGQPPERRLGGFRLFNLRRNRPETAPRLNGISPLDQGQLNEETASRPLGPGDTSPPRELESVASDSRSTEPVPESTIDGRRDQPPINPTDPKVEAAVKQAIRAEAARVSGSRARSLEVFVRGPVILVRVKPALFWQKKALRHDLEQIPKPRGYRMVIETD